MSFFSILSTMLTPAPLPDAVTRHALARIGDLVDGHLVNARGFTRVMTSPVQHALDYCNHLVTSVPGPLAIERRAFVGDPLVHALFATGSDIDQMLGRSQAVRDFIDQAESHSAAHFYALFAARRMEKQQLGVEMLGDTVQSDVPQTVLYFSDHTLTEPAASLEEARQRLLSATFDSLLRTFRAHLDELRAEREGARSHLSAERGNLTALRGKMAGDEVFVQTRRIAVLDEHLREVAASLMPEAVLQALGTFLRTPEASLSLEPCSVTVDRMGVVTHDDAPSGTVDRLEFPELIARDRRRYLVTMARIDCEEARRSIRESIERQRRYVLI